MINLEVKVLNVEVDSIEVGERFRLDYGDLTKLIESFKSYQLIQPIAVTNLGISEPGKLYQLLAGGRRLAAAKLLQDETRRQTGNESFRLKIGARIYERELDDTDRLELELEENAQRKDFTEVERAMLRAKIFESYQVKFGKRADNKSKGGVSQEDIAKKLGISAATLSKDMDLSARICKFPQQVQEQLRSLVSKAEVERLMESLSRQARTGLDAMRIEDRQEKMRSDAAKISDDPAVQRQIRLDKFYNTYTIGDFFELSVKLPDHLFDLVEFDPPWGAEIADIKEGASTVGKDQYVDWRVEEYLDKLPQALRIFKRVMRSGWIIMWYKASLMPEITKIFKQKEFKEFTLPSVPAIWNRDILQGKTQNPKYVLGSGYEGFLYIRRGDVAILKQGLSNVFTCPPVPTKKKIHPTHKPVELYQQIFSTFLHAGQTILVPCAGSGTSLIAALRNNCIPQGYDLAPSFKQEFQVALDKEQNI